MSKTSLIISLAAAVGSAAMVTPAQAHISTIGPLKDRGGNQKTEPCGGEGRSATPYTFEPGTTITLGVSEDIRHDGYFRISFDNDGEDGFQDPESIDPVNPNRYGTGKKCQGTDADRCGESDFCNVVSSSGPTVLWDNLNPHLGSASEGDYTWTVKLPDVECDNCTIQIQQVMEDPLGNAHGPFDGRSDLYYLCVDIVLKKGATPSAGVATGTPKNDGMECLASAGGGGESKSDAAAPPDSKGDAGVGSSSGASDAGSGSTGSGNTPSDADDDSDDDAPATGTKVDAGKPATSKADASTTKKDAGAASHEGHDEAEDDSENDGDVGSQDDKAPEASDDGCSVSSSSTSAQGWSFLLSALATAALVASRRRRS